MAPNPDSARHPSTLGSGDDACVFNNEARGWHTVRMPEYRPVNRRASMGRRMVIARSVPVSERTAAPPRTSLVTRTTCRVCDSPHLAPVLSLGEQHIAGAFAQPNGRQPVNRAIPLELVRCDMTRDQNACGLIQTRHTVPGAILYHSYWYRSGVNRTMTANLHEIARQAEELVGLRPGDLVVDIGCNDGTLFDGYDCEQLRYL